MYKIYIVDRRTSLLPQSFERGSRTCRRRSSRGGRSWIGRLRVRRRIRNAAVPHIAGTHRAIAWVHHGGGGGQGRGGAVEDEQADQAAVEHADPAGHRDQVRQVPDLIGEHDRREWGDEAGGGEAGGEDGDVAPQERDRPDDPPIAPEQDLLGEADAGGDLDQQGADPTR